MTPDEQPTTTAVVTVSYNSQRHLGPFLESARHELGSRGTILVIDNGSTDIDAVREAVEAADARLLQLNSNLGYGGAVNLGVAELPPEIDAVLVSNPDVVLHAGSLAELARVLRETPDAGAVGPRILNPDGSYYPSARNLPSLRAGMGHALLGRLLPRNRWTRAYLSDVAARGETTRAGWISGACLLVERDAFQAIGGFDSAYFMYFEDVDLGYRLAQSGRFSYFVPTATVTHTGAHSTSGESRRMIEAHHRSAYRYLSRKYTSWYLAPLRAILRLGLAMRSRWVSRS